jgi:hypothetical protein
MKSMLTYIAMAIAVVALWFVMKSREGFAAEFVDHTNARLTDSNKDSSYDQKTNHMVMPAGPVVPIQGMESPFRVNMANAFIP